MGGAVLCKVTLSGELAQCVIDTGSGIFLVNRSFVAKHRIPILKWQGPLVMVADTGILKIHEASMMEIDLLGLSLISMCGVVDLAFDSLLGMDSLRQTPLLLNFEKMLLLLNPETNENVWLSCMTRTITCDSNDVIFSQDKAFPFVQSDNEFTDRTAASIQANCRINERFRNISKRQALNVEIQPDPLGANTSVEEGSQTSPKINLAGNSSNTTVDSENAELIAFGYLQDSNEGCEKEEMWALSHWEAQDRYWV